MNTLDKKVSVVVASKVGAPFIDDCLASLANQQNAPEYEVIVVECHGKETQDRIAKDFPWVHLIRQKTKKTIPDLRRIGVEHANGEIIAILEEHCLAAKDWIHTIVKAHENACAAVGGSVLDKNYDRLRDWVTYFCEYNAYMPPVASGEVHDVPGNNVAFKQDVLRKHLANLDHGYWEAFLYSSLQSEKAALLSEPQMVVFHRGPFDYGYYLRQRYLFSRAFSGARRSVMPKSRRAIYALASPLLPALLLGRMAMRVWKKRCHVGKFLVCLPMLVPVSIVYVFGEVVGYLAGPGDALMEVE